MNPAPLWARPAAWRPRLAVMAVAGAVGLLGGCAPPGDDVTQVAARVNDADVTVHQVNFALQQQDPAARPEQAEAAGRRVLESLIDQELAVQKALELKLDRDPQVVQALEAARREVLARAWRERISQTGVRPTADEVRRFYDGAPGLFAERRVYSLRELAIDVPADRVAQLKQRLAQGASAEAFASQLTADGLRFAVSEPVTPAEELPMALVRPFAQLRVGDSAVVADGPPLRVVFVNDVRQAPLTLESAAPSIEQYLTTQARRRAIDDTLRALRSAAQIRYHGRFADGVVGGAVSAPAASDAEARPRASTEAVQLPLREGSTDPIKLKLPDAAPAPAQAGSAIDPNLAKKGMGLK